MRIRSSVTKALNGLVMLFAALLAESELVERHAENSDNSVLNGEFHIFY